MIIGSNPVLGENGKIPQIGYTSRSSTLGDSRAYGNHLRTVPGYYHDALVIAELLQDFFSWDKVTLFATTGSYGSQAAFRFKDEADRRGIEILSSHSFLQDSADLSSEIKAAKAAGARVFVLLVGASDGLNLLQQGYKLGLFNKNTQIIGGTHMSTSSDWEKRLLDKTVASYMEGFIGVRWNIDLFPSEQVTEFVKRWKAKNNTNGVVQPDGSVLCDDRMDYYNEFYLHQFPDFFNKSAPPVCAGVDFSSYTGDGSDLVGEMYAYDAVVAIALALHHIAYVQGVCDPQPAEVLYYLQHELSFKGLTGNVSFSTKYKDQFFDVGGRETSLVYDILNYNSEDSGFKEVAKWHSELGFLPCDGHVRYDPRCHDFTFRTRDNSVALDSPPPHLIAMYPYFSSLMWLFAVLCLLMVTIVFLVVVVFHSRRICRMAQPGMILLNCFGLGLACVRVILAAGHLTAASCTGEFWTGHLAFIIIVTTLGVKTWRVYLVTNAMKKVRVSESKCIGIVLGVVCTTVLVMAVHSAIGIIHVEDVTIVQNQFEYDKQRKCVARNDDAMHALHAMEAVLFCFSARMLWCTRHVASTISSTGTSATGKSCVCYTVYTYY